MRDGLRQLFRRPVSLPGVVCSVLVAALGVVALWALPSLLARHPSQGMTAAQRLAAVNAIRTATVTFLVAVGAAVTVWFTARTYSLSREGHVTDRYTSAVSQLGSDSPYVRVGGIYALERIGHDSVGAEVCPERKEGPM
jgi:hypothetical protein